MENAVKPKAIRIISLYVVGSAVFDEIVVVLLKTSMFIGGGVAFFLDNTIPGRWYNASMPEKSHEPCPTTESPINF